MRRKDREITSQESVLSILDRAEVLHLALSDDNKPYVLPLNFACVAEDGQIVVYLHGASKGRKLDIIAKNPHVCFEALCSYEILPGEAPCDYSANYESTIGEGLACVVEDPAEKVRGLDAIMKHYGYEGQTHYPADMLRAVTVLKITVSALSGKARYAAKGV
ncbi:MAG: pyridoxamine 5'-phosphate oxidase family protein [Clostridiales Family XIII bacterium]|nr:pyridoxamine 5'-phosphate oxidase family protein [Clostridiales Family XIII bacterium]